MAEISLERINIYPYILAVWTDRADFVTEIIGTDKLLEVRAFGEKGEYRAFRTNTDDGFKICESDDEGKNFFDEYHYLDIDTTLGGGDLFSTTGSGSYHIPYDDVRKLDKKLLIVRFYYESDEDGVNRKTSFRLVGFTDKAKRQEG